MYHCLFEHCSEARSLEVRCEKMRLVIPLPLSESIKKLSHTCRRFKLTVKNIKFKEIFLLKISKIFTKKATACF